MPITFNEENGGRLLAIHVSGKLVAADYYQLVPEFERLVLQHGKLDVLFNMTDFDGWDAAVFWDNIRFDLKHLSDSNRLAMVGGEKWQRAMAKCCERFTKATVKYFDHSATSEARKWLLES
jgi:hypothetical protein